MPIIEALLIGATAILVLATLLPLSRNTQWWIRMWEFPRLQLLWSGIALVILLALSSIELSLQTGLILATLCCVLWQAWWIWPYSPLQRVEVPDSTSPRDSPSLKLLTANVLMTSRSAPQLLRLIRDNDPDVVLTMETDAWWEEQLDVLHKKYPYRMACALDNLYGMHLYSRLRLIDPKIQFLVQKDIPSIHTMLELSEGLQVSAHFVHPAPPSPTENERSIQRDAELILVAETIAGHDEPTIVAGDLNDTAWSATTRIFRNQSGLLDLRVGRGLFNTFHAKIPVLRIPLDHIFVSRHFSLTALTRLPAYGSDHFAMLTDMSVAKHPLGTQEHIPDHDQRRKSIEARIGHKTSDMHDPKKSAD